MAKQKRYTVYKSGGAPVDYVYASCITKAAKHYAERLPHTAKITVYSTAQARITFDNNHTIMSNYVIIAD